MPEKVCFRARSGCIEGNFGLFRYLFTVKLCGNRMFCARDGCFVRKVFVTSKVWRTRRYFYAKCWGSGKILAHLKAVLCEKLQRKTGFGLRHPRGRSPRGPLKADRCAAHNIFAPFHPLCKRGLQRSVIAQKKDDATASSGLLLSGKRGSNPRPSAWEADALPTELFPRLFMVQQMYITFFIFS